MGVHLIARMHKMGLTPAGQELYRHAVRIVKDAQTAIGLVQAAARGADQQVRVGVTGYTPIDFLTWLEKLNELEGLGISVIPRVLLLQRIVDELVAENLELGLVRLPLNTDALHHKVILKDPFVALLPRSHILGGQPDLELSALRNETFVDIARERGGYFPYTSTACKDVGFAPRRILVVDSRQSLLSNVAAGRGIALYPASLASAAWKDVAVVRLTDVKVRCDLAVAWKPVTSFGKRAAELLDRYPSQQAQFQ